MRINTAGTFHHYLWVGSERNLPGTTPVVPGAWYHVAIVAQNSGPMRLYVNGQEDAASIDTTGTLWASGDRIHVGSNSGHGMGWFEGLVDELHIYNRELSATQIHELARGLVPSFTKAEKPNPADGTVGVGVPLLQWSKGETAIFHNVYLGTDPNLTESNLASARQPSLLYYHVPGLAPGATYYWRVDEVEKDGVTIHTGDVWSFVAQDVTAYYPGPADGDNTVSTAPTLTWMPGTHAVQHHVYFGESADVVRQGAAEVDKGAFPLANAAFEPGVLETLTTYYWRVDEVLIGNAVQAGPLWSFVTALPIDDFESYNDDDNRIFDTWIDGWTNGTGSTVGNVETPFAERTIVHDANQSMPLDYNNVDEPFYSEAEREFSSAQDWTADGVDTLVLYVRGRPGNASAPLYVALEDASNKTAAVTYPDPAIVTATKWAQWKIPLSDFAGVNLSRVRKIVLGVGDKADPKAGGTGRMYIDDIRLAVPAR